MKQLRGGIFHGRKIGGDNSFMGKGIVTSVEHKG
jgi:hypothetical protein